MSFNVSKSSYPWDYQVPFVLSLLQRPAEHARQPQVSGTLYVLFIVVPSVHVSLTVLSDVDVGWQQLHLLLNPCMIAVYCACEEQYPEHSIRSWTGSVFLHVIPYELVTVKNATLLDASRNIRRGIHVEHWDAFSEETKKIHDRDFLLLSSQFQNYLNIYTYKTSMTT